MKKNQKTFMPFMSFMVDSPTGSPSITLHTLYPHPNYAILEKISITLPTSRSSSRHHNPGAGKDIARKVGTIMTLLYLDYNCFQRSAETNA